MPHNLHNTLQTFKLSSGATGPVLLAAGARSRGRRPRVKAARVDPHRARKRASQLRWSVYF